MGNQQYNNLFYDFMKDKLDNLERRIDKLENAILDSIKEIKALKTLLTGINGDNRISILDRVEEVENRIDNISNNLEQIKNKQTSFLFIFIALIIVITIMLIERFPAILTVIIHLLNFFIK